MVDHINTSSTQDLRVAKPKNWPLRNVDAQIELVIDKTWSDLILYLRLNIILNRLSMTFTFLRSANDSFLGP